ncbi:hypothetical protein [Jeotgalibacillus proteolyticus]|uniref:Uncharacterized protein n=1 Tax=Jeotgalibacillus proteolyticus TaxID=2082395 RepID=A0A2S5GAV6_9BACL|nr:hypothetical protein [Jeotgalibacillus proteolyticus]PPA70055.1 hypothetical protein C4B60_10700 [Jeotgalibacillus proteolyticus]
MNFIGGLFSDSNFLGALVGSILSGIVAVGVYVMNLKNIRDKEKNKERIDNYKEFKILESCLSDLSSYLKEIIEGLNQNDFGIVKAYSEEIIRLEHRFNTIDIKRFVTEKEIFLHANSIIANYRFFNNICTLLLDRASQGFENEEPKKQFITSIKKIKSGMDESYSKIRKSLIDLKYKV